MSLGMMMMMTMTIPMGRIKAIRTWDQPAFADLGETPYSISAASCKTQSLAGAPWIDKNGYPITEYDDVTDENILNNTYVNCGWQDRWDLGLFDDDICFAYLGESTTRPSTGYKLEYQFVRPESGVWKSDLFSRYYTPWRPYRAATGSNRITHVVEENGQKSVNLIDQADGSIETVSYTTFTDTDDFEHLAASDTGTTVAAKKGTIDTTNNMIRRSAASVGAPFEQKFKIGSSASNSYNGFSTIRTKWADGKTWTMPYWATCFVYGEYWYSFKYSEGDDVKLNLVPMYDGLTNEAGFFNEVPGKFRTIMADRNSKRRFKPVFDDGWDIPEPTEQEVL